MDTYQQFLLTFFFFPTCELFGVATPEDAIFVVYLLLLLLLLLQSSQCWLANKFKAYTATYSTRVSGITSTLTYLNSTYQCWIMKERKQHLPRRIPAKLLSTPRCSYFFLQ